jgi:hypothetical protein
MRLRLVGPALTEVEAAIDVVNGSRDRPAGSLRLNVPVSAARLVLASIVPPFLAAYHRQLIAMSRFHVRICTTNSGGDVTVNAVIRCRKPAAATAPLPGYPQVINRRFSANLVGVRSVGCFKT